MLETISMQITPSGESKARTSCYERPASDSAFEKRTSVEIPCSSCNVHKQAICSGLVEKEIGEFGRNVRIRRVKAGQSVYREFEEAKYIFTIVTGEIRLANLLDDGRRQVTAFKSAGEVIGENQNGHYQSDAEAVCETMVCQIPIKVLNQHIDGNPIMRDALMEMIRKELSELRQHAVLLGRKTPVEKIASFLLDRVGKSVSGNEKAIEITLPMGRSDIADYLGLTIETVSRTITKLKNLEVISVPTTHSILIINRPQLESLAEGEQ